MYATVNFKTKKALKEAVAEGREVGVYQPNNFFAAQPPEHGTVAVEGPWYPAPHSWWATVTVEHGKIVKVR